MTAFPCILFQRLHVWQDGQFCAVHTVAGVLRSVCHVNPIFVFATQEAAEARKRLLSSTNSFRGLTKVVGRLQVKSTKQMSVSDLASLRQKPQQDQMQVGPPPLPVSQVNCVPNTLQPCRDPSTGWRYLPTGGAIPLPVPFYTRFSAWLKTCWEPS